MLFLEPIKNQEPTPKKVVKREFTAEVGYAFYVEVNIDEAMNCNGSLDIFLEKLANIMNCDICNLIISRSKDITFELIDKINNKIITLEIIDENEHITDFILNVFNKHINIAPFHTKVQISKIQETE